MVTYEKYLKLQDNYVKGLKSITQKTFHPSVSINKNPQGKLKISSESFKAHYNIKGKLIHLINLLPHSKKKYSYYYDSAERVVKILEISKDLNILLKENNIKYKDNINFIEYISDYFDIASVRSREIHHSKFFDAICVEQKNCPKDEWFLHQTIKYDNIIEVSFDKGNNIQLLSISELNTNKQVIKSYDYYLEYNDNLEVIDLDVDIKYNPEEYYVNEYYGSGLLKSTSFISNSPWVRTFEYKFNERGHWIEKISFLDGVLQYYCERKLEYF